MSGERVVVVDDDDGFRHLVVASLRSQGFNIVGSADSAASGRDVVARERPDIVVHDVRLPDMDGFDSVPLLREAAPDVLVVLMSGSHPADLESRRRRERVTVIDKAHPPMTWGSLLRDLLVEFQRNPSGAPAEE